MKRDDVRFRKANPIDISSVMPSLIKKLDISLDIRLEKIKKNWQKIVGTTNARHTRPLSLIKGTLTVNISSSAWITQAQFLKPSFIKKINAYDPDEDAQISDIHFTLNSY